MTTDKSFSTEAARWQAVLERNPQADGQFVYAVTTTGIYCRPTCSSRKPKRANARFFDAPPAAEAAGFRPCKRCTPHQNAPQPGVEAVAQAVRLIETAEREPTLSQLAEAVGMSAYHFQRVFKKTMGVTPKQYAIETRLGRVRRNLRQTATVTEAVYNAGFESGSRFYETAGAALGMKPAQYRQGGRGTTIRYATARSYLGWVLVAATDRGVCRIDFGNSPDDLQTRLQAAFPHAKLQADDPDFDKTITETLAFLDAPEQGLALPLDVQGTAFQRRVWTALQTIPAGKTASYGEIAAQIGQPNAARAVAQACASNRIAVAIPCHRVVRRNGDLGGYRWGTERKRAILQREAR